MVRKRVRKAGAVSAIRFQREFQQFERRKHLGKTGKIMGNQEELMENLRISDNQNIPRKGVPISWWKLYATPAVTLGWSLSHLAGPGLCYEAGWNSYGQLDPRKSWDKNFSSGSFNLDSLFTLRSTHTESSSRNMGMQLSKENIGTQQVFRQPTAPWYSLTPHWKLTEVQLLWKIRLLLRSVTS